MTRDRAATPRLVAFGLAATLGLGAAGCGGDAADGGGASADDELLAFCLDENSRFRAMVGKAAFVRSKALEAYAAEGAQTDGAAHKAHSHFSATKGGGIASAENEIPWWPSRQGDTRAIIAKGIQQMFDEGPGEDFQKHGHYLNITGPYTQLGCGISIQGDETTVTMDFSK